MKIYKGFDIYSNINPASLWSVLPYAGEQYPPVPEEPESGQWPTFFFDRDQYGNFTDRNGNKINFRIKEPDASIDFKGKQLELVQQTLENITRKQIQIAEYWGEGPPTKQWTPIIDRLIDTYGSTAPEAGRILGLVQAALNDAFVITWYYKFLWNIARPNQLDQNLVTVICTPKHPSYPSGHAVVAGCAQVVLSHFFKGEYGHLKQLAEECAISRLYGGVHYPIDNQQGLRLGRHIGEMVVSELEQQHTPDDKPIIKPYNQNLNAKLPPPPYKQSIPFNRSKKCSSKTIFNT